MQPHDTLILPLHSQGEAHLLEPIGNIPPAEAEARYHAEQEDIALAA